MSTAGALVESPEQLESYLAGSSAMAGWIVKAEHGNAGLANRRLRHQRLTAADRRFVEDRLSEDDRLVVEPWLPRERDWCVVFDAPFDPRRLRVHETLYTADGALIGALFEPPAVIPGAPLEQLGTVAERVAADLAREGYSGPVCVDAFTWSDGDRRALRPLVDLNCRLAMSDSAYRLWRRLAPERTFFYRFFSCRKIDLGDDLSAALEALGPQRYDPNSRRGILLASPLRVGEAGESWRPGKLAVAFVADDRSSVFEQERGFRRAFEV
jgi:hypothetical protein